ncbi:uncharacterized protein H6S33_007905 [Morchella sextelata]|uniref:uncharacterized protein n=1 Tax=Morchella sextelata TaxID=1174677 RepID=UPI001D04B9F3|nr:uncharacterized protein H6S33_007905 [Morchella sextelata]KAH0603583.1 hypothetical protein H6S33_007905 [Morchella sextelata]
MAPKSIFPSSPLSLEAIKLGRLVLNTRYPQQDYIDPSTESPKFTKSPLHDFEEIRSSVRASGLRTRLASLLSMTFENRDDYLVDFSAAKSFTFLLDNSKAWFARACGNPESRTWLNHAIEDDANVYLVVGFHTLVDARVTERGRISESGDLSTGVKITGGGIPGVGGFELTAEVGAGSGQGHRFQRMFATPGEQIYAVQYRKVKFNWYSSRKVETAFLEPNNRWKPCLGVRGEVSTGVDDVVEVEINEGGEDEDEDEDEDEGEDKGEDEDEDEDDEDEDEDEDDGEDEEDIDEEKKGVRPVGVKSNKVTEKYVTESGGIEFVF